MEMEQVQAVKEQWRARRKVLKDEFMALLDLESRSSLQQRRLQELLDALDAHDASKPSSGSSKRKKKRRRRKLPKAPLPRCGRPCALQRQVPAVLRVLRASGSDPRQNGGHSCCAAERGSHSFLHIPGQGRCARVAQRQGYGQTVQNSVLVPQLPFVADRRHPFRASESGWTRTPRSCSVRVGMRIRCCGQRLGCFSSC